MKNSLLLSLIWIVGVFAQTYNWPAVPFDQQHGINGTFCENRPGGSTERHHFHDGVDIALSEGGTVYSILSTTVTSLNPSGGNAYIRIGRYAYVHVTPNPNLDVGDAVSAFQTTVGATNYKNHIHFKDGYPGSEINAIRSGGGLFPMQDAFKPGIATIRFYENGTTHRFTDNRVSGLVDIVSQAYDKTNDGYSGSNNGIYRMGYQIYDSTGNTALSPLIVPFQFDQIPSSDSFITNVYFSGSDISTYIYIPTNKISGDGFWDTRTYAPGPYQVMIEVEDTRHNITRRFQRVEVVAQDVTPPAIPKLLSFTGNASGDWDLTWLPNDSGDVAGYHLEFSYDAENWSDNTALSQGINVSDTLLHYTGFPLNRLFFLRLSAFDDAAPVNTSHPSPPLGIMLKSHKPHILLMGNSVSAVPPAKQFVPLWSNLLANADSAFNSATISALYKPAFNPGIFHYWIFSLEGSDLLHTRSQIENFLNGKGMLTLSAPDFAIQGQTSGGDTLENWRHTLHADYNGIIGESDSLIGEPGTQMEGFRAAIDTVGLKASLISLIPAGKFSRVLLRYKTPEQQSAAIYKPRRVGQLPQDGSLLVYCGFPIEHIQGQDKQTEFLERLFRMNADSAVHIDIDTTIVPPEPGQLLQIGMPYPNPANTMAGISFFIPDAGTINMDLVDIRGRKVWLTKNIYLFSGKQKIMINTAKTASGLYFLRMHIQNKIYFRKLLIIH